MTRTMSTQTNTCNICGHTFKTKAEVKDHLNGFHNDGNEETGCRECGSKVHDQVEFCFEDETHASGGVTTVTAAASITTRKSIEVATAAATAETHPKFTCKKCGRVFKTGTEVKKSHSWLS